jgi:hypothetical protein
MTEQRTKILNPAQLRSSLMILVALVLTIAASVGIVSRGEAVATPGSTIFSAVGHYKVVLGRSTDSSPMSISIDAGATVPFAVIGYQSAVSAPLISAIPVAINGAAVGSFPAVSQELPTLQIGQGAIVFTGSAQSYADITSLVGARGSGNYAIDTPITPEAGFVSAQSFFIAVEQDPSYPLTSVAINDFFFSATAGMNVEENISVNVDLPAITNPEQYVQTSEAGLLVLGASFDASDASSANFVAGSSSGPLTNDNSTTPAAGQFWPRFRWGLSNFQMDINAAQLTLNIDFTADTTGEDAGGWVIVVAPLVVPGGITPEMPVVYPENPEVITPTVPRVPDTGLGV